LTGYRRHDGGVGIRNHVAVLPFDDVSNVIARAIAARVTGVVPLCHSYGEMQYGADEALTVRTLVGTATNPNVAAVVVIASERAEADNVAESVARTGRPVEALATWNVGDVPTIAKGVRAAAKMLRDASAASREPIRPAELTLSLKCGESDATTALASGPTTGWVTDHHVGLGGTVIFGETSELTGGVDILASRCRDGDVRAQLVAAYDRYVAPMKASGVDLMGSQPTLANIRGGISTIEEKAIGTISKTGTAPIVSVVGPAEAPQTCGLTFMDTSASAGECVTLMAAGGAVLHLFPCGGGNVVGHPILPVLKVSAHPTTVAQMSDHVDVDVSGLLRGEYDIAGAGARLWQAVAECACGTLTCAEALGHRELIITKLYPSA
jgi:(2R)-sulfolactate sulfo-lyase subunit beta